MQATQDRTTGGIEAVKRVLFKIRARRLAGASAHAGLLPAVTMPLSVPPLADDLDLFEQRHHAAAVRVASAFRPAFVLAYCTLKGVSDVTRLNVQQLERLAELLEATYDDDAAAAA